MTRDIAVIAYERPLNDSVLVPSGLIAVGAFLVLTIWGVAARDVVGFAAFEILFVLAPGLLLYKTLMPSVRGMLRPLATGWALGYVMVSLAYLLCAYSGHRELFVFYAPAILAVLIPLARRRVGPFRANMLAPASPGAWGIALVCLALIVNMGVGYFPSNPLPGTVSAITYSIDTSWHIGNAAEARWHWPITDPRVAGEPLPYYTFVYLYLAAINQVTGIALPVIVLRLYFLHFSLLNALQLYALGRAIGGRRWVGLLAAAGVLFIGEVDPFPVLTTPFENYFINSPTTFLGMLLFVPLILELSERLRRRSTWLEWVPVFILLIGSAGAKAALLPVIGAGLALFLLAAFCLDRKINWNAATALTACVACYLFFSNFVYGDLDARVTFKPLDALKTSQLVAWLQTKLGFPDGWLVLAIAPVFVGALGVRALALGWLVRRGVQTWPRVYLWIGSLSVAALIPYYLLASPRQVQFWTYFYVTASILATVAFRDWWRHGHRLSRPLAVVLILMLVSSVIDKPLDTAARNVYRLWTHRPVYNQANRNVTRGLYEALAWIRDNTPRNAVIAVNSYYVDDTRLDPRYFNYSAFAERRVFLEGWGYTVAAYRDGYADVITGKAFPYADRLELCSRVFNQGEASAIKKMARDYGVTHLLVDRIHGQATPMLDAIATRVHDDPDATVYAIN